MSGAVVTESSNRRVVAEVVIPGADVAAVYAAVSDVERMADFSPEGRGVLAAPGPLKVGDRFGGSNRNGWHRWSTTCTVAVAEPGREFAFDVTHTGLGVARWSYAIEPVEAGVLVRETWTDARGWLMTTAGRFATGVADRSTHNAQTMLVTLDAMCTTLSPRP